VDALVTAFTTRIPAAPCSFIRSIGKIEDPFTRRGLACDAFIIMIFPSRFKVISPLFSPFFPVRISSGPDAQKDEQSVTGPALRKSMKKADERI
jgi:hypothetical protein